MGKKNNRQEEADQKLKKDYGKLRMDLIPVEAIEELAKVLTYGLKNGYGEESWKEVEPKRYHAALMRHYVAYRKGEDVDSESNIKHLSHILCNTAFLLWQDINKSA